MMEKFLRYVHTVDTLTEAFAFVMDHMDEFEKPSISIQAMSIYSLSDLNDENAEGKDSFEVSVSGTVTM